MDALGVAVASGAGYVVGDGVAVSETGKAGPLLLRVSRLPWGSTTWTLVGAPAWPPCSRRVATWCARSRWWRWRCGPRHAIRDAPRSLHGTGLRHRCRDDFVLVHLHWEAHLQLLHRGLHGVADACLHRVDAVLIGAGAHATAEGLVADVTLAGAGVLASEGQDGGGALGAG